MVSSTLPLLDSAYPVSEDQTRSFQRNGHILLPGILSAEEVGVYRSEIVATANTLNSEKRKLEDRDTYGKAFLQIMNLWRASEAVKKFTLAKRFGKIAADLLGVDNVRIYHDQALFKEPGGGPTPWHQDQYYWPLDTRNTVTMWMPLIPIDESMGMLSFASGSHKDGCLFNTEISDESEKVFDDYVAEKGFPLARAPFMNAGDATWHYGSTIHQAPGNHSATMREVMTIIYIADGAKITQPANTWQENDRVTWLKALPVGSLVSSDLNPSVL